MVLVNAVRLIVHILFILALVVIVIFAIISSKFRWILLTVALICAVILAILSQIEITQRGEQVEMQEQPDITFGEPPPPVPPVHVEIPDARATDWLMILMALGSAAKPGRSREQVCVLVARDRAGATVNHVLPEFSKDTLVNVLQPVLAEDTLLCSDGHSVYKAFAADAGVIHKMVNLSAGIRVVEKVFHVQNVNTYHSRFKRWLRRFNGVATKYLPNYLGWYRWLDKNANVPTPQAWFLTAVGSS